MRRRLRSLVGPALASGLFLAMGTAAEPPQRPDAVAPAAEDALDSSPAPVRAEPPEPAREAPDLPPAAQSGAWRGGARPPGEVPAGVVVRAALRTPAPGKRAGERSSEPPRAIEIVWNAPGS
jgi:hypothetical protein